MKTKQTSRDMSFWAMARRFPPPLVRLLAKRSSTIPRTCEEIATLSNMDVPTVRFIASRNSWDFVPFGQMRRFTQACGVDFDDTVVMHRIDVYVKAGPRWSYLRRSPDWKAIYEPLFVIYLNAIP